jgi:serine/threonine-protein kinase
MPTPEERAALAGGTVIQEDTQNPAHLSQDTYSLASSSPPLPPGTLLGSYRLVSLIAEGGMGQVYEAEHIHLDRKVALKLMHPEVAERTKAVKRFFSEARAVNKIHHKNIVEITDIVDSGAKEKFYIMELLEGETLSSRLKRQRYLPVPLALDLAVQLASALSAVHAAGIVHRDLKPPNIFLVETGELPRLKLLDFGVAKLLEAGLHRDVTKTSAGAILGTPHFMAPEQFNSEPVDARTDVYAFGLLLYLMVTGEMVFAGNNLGELTIQHLTRRPIQAGKRANVPQDIPAALDKLILHCLEKEAANRPSSMEEVRRALVNVDPEQAPATAEFSIPTQSNRKGLWAAVAIAALGLAVGVPTLLSLTASKDPVALVEAPISPPPEEPRVPQEVMVKSEPPGALILSLPDKMPLGKTPLAMMRPGAGENLQVRIELEGHLSMDLEIGSEGEAEITKRLSPLPDRPVAAKAAPTAVKSGKGRVTSASSKRTKKSAPKSTKSDKKRSTRGVILNPFGKKP